MELLVNPNCQECELAEFRTQVVQGEGPIPSNIMLLLEAPGKEEDEKGRPAIGKAGQKLDGILESVGIDRKETWVDNCLHCRPPDNDIRRFPNAQVVCQVAYNVGSYQPRFLCPKLYLQKTIDIIKPKVIMAMGATAASRWFPGREAREIAELQRELVNGITVVGSFHPSYALRMGEEIEESIRRSLMRAKDICSWDEA